MGRLIYRLKNESAAHELFSYNPTPCPPGLLLFPSLSLFLSVLAIDWLSGSLGSAVAFCVAGAFAAQPRGERQSVGLAFALNRVDILSLPWKVERTLETLGGFQKNESYR